MRTIITVIVIISMLAIAGLMAHAVFVAVVDAGAVGISGRITFDGPLEPGGTYDFHLSVINPGDTASDFELSLGYMEGQTEKRLDGWIDFFPSRFHLEPGKSIKVKIVLTVPILAEQGEYFAFVEAHPVKSENGTTIGVAAGSKLSFEVKSSNVLLSLFVKGRGWFEDNKSSVMLVFAVLALCTIGVIGKRYLSIGLKKNTVKPYDIVDDLEFYRKMERSGK